jgi:hypothetical protein
MTLLLLNMAERELYNNHQCKPFPFEFVASRFAQSLATTLHKLEYEDIEEPQADFVTALNAILVWNGARTATLPSWDYCHQDCVIEFVDYINKVSRQIPAWAGTVDELIIVRRP